MKKKLTKLLVPFVGFIALVWFLIRVIPKPSRANYPCMRAAFPLASGFVIYLLGLFSTAFALGRLKKHWKEGYKFTAVFLLIVLLIGSSFIIQSDKSFSFAAYQVSLEEPNSPIGKGVGVFPGRVVWVHDSTAVDQKCKNSNGDFWFQDANTNQTVVNKMVSDALQSLTGKSTDAEAWDAIFRNYNKTHGKGDVGYTKGEKFVIKLNLNTGASGTSNTRGDNRTIDTSPQVVFAVLNQLINVVGAAQEDIGFGDPGRNVDNIFWDKFHSTFPNVKYWGDGTGRTHVDESDNMEFRSSDGQIESPLPKCYLDAAYMINIPVFKQHHRAGVSLTCKNHFGTFVRHFGDAFSLHYSLPSTQGDGNVDNGSYHQYRIFVDFIGHKDLGRKTILYLIDGLWSSTNYGDPAWKWRMAPFNNHYPASIFMSQDPVAIESVGFDFLYNEFNVGNPSGNAFPRYAGVDDYMHQAADSTNWPEDMKYDPEADGTILPGSMGVHEHWNNAVDKKYSKNLGTGEGIELVKVGDITAVNENKSSQKIQGFYLNNNYPNPFNPSTTITYQIPNTGTHSRNFVQLKVYDLLGHEVAVLVNKEQAAGSYSVNFNAFNFPSGTYLYKLKAGNFTETKKMILMK